MDLLQRLFDALGRAEALLANTEETDRAKLVDRLASEYTQLKYLIQKAQSENCKIVDSISPVRSTFRVTYEVELMISVSTRLNIVSVVISLHYLLMPFETNLLRISDNALGHMI